MRSQEDKGVLWLGVGISLGMLLVIVLLLRDGAPSRRRDELSLLTTILDVTPAAIWVKDIEGRFVIVNDLTARQIGLTKDEIIGRRTADVIPADAAARIAGWDKEALARPGVTVGGEKSFHFDDELGTKHILNFRRTCDLDEQTMIVGSSMDITELRCAEEELRSEMRRREAAEADLHQAQKMEAIGRLTGGVAHDFNNLLTSIIGNVELALTLVSDERVRGLLQRAGRSGQRAADHIQHLLSFARKQHLHTRSIDINALVQGMKDLLGHSLGAMIRIEANLYDGVWPAMADANQLETALLNIAINARDAMPAGGRLIIRTANILAGSSAHPAELPHADFVAISLDDTGIGMGEDILARAFDPFFTTKEVGKGSGLGLSQVYGMARQCGGTAKINSAPGTGTTVVLYLPRAEAAPDGAAGCPITARPCDSATNGGAGRSATTPNAAAFSGSRAFPG